MEPHELAVRLLRERLFYTKRDLRMAQADEAQALAAQKRLTRDCEKLQQAIDGLLSVGGEDA